MVNGYILWEGASLLDGAPIVVIATGFAQKSSNRKTGGMIQTYILRTDVDPVAAVNSGRDASICGDCPHRGTSDGQRNSGRTCYVNVGQGALAVYRAYKRGTYPLWDGYGVNLRKVRLGTYGDPAAAPAHVWEAITRDASGHTGYTHQWRNLNAAHLRSLCMASADSPADAVLAQSMGWRTFRVGMWGEVERDRAGLTESLCPASEQAGKKLTCDTCLACDGAGTAKRGSIFIPAHGGTAVMANVKKRGLGIPVTVEMAA